MLRTSIQNVIRVQCNTMHYMILTKRHDSCYSLLLAVGCPVLGYGRDLMPVVYTRLMILGMRMRFFSSFPSISISYLKRKKITAPAFHCPSCLPGGIGTGTLESGLCNRPVGFIDLTGCGTPGCLRINIHPVPSKTGGLIVGEVTPGPQAFKGRTISFTLTYLYKCISDQEPVMWQP